MKKILIDTNSLISFVVDRDDRQNRIMYDLFSGKEKVQIILISNVVSEFVYVLDKIYQVDPSLINSMIQDLLKMPNLEFSQGYYPEVIFALWPQKIKDFGDAVIAAASIYSKCPIYTFDKKLTQQLKALKCDYYLLK
jgi:predicted nucleic-acid-binding protein